MIREKFWRVLYATIATLLRVRTEYLRGEIPIPSSDGIFIQIFGTLFIFFFVVVAWFWDNKRIYLKLIEDAKKPISYKTYLNMGTIYFFLLMMFYIFTSFIFPVPTTYHYGR